MMILVLVESDYSLVGRRSGRKFRIGDKVYIKVVSANLAKRQLDFEWVLKPEDEQSVQNGSPKTARTVKGKAKDEAGKRRRQRKTK